MTLDPEESKKLEKYFGTKKFYIQLVSIIFGIILVVFLFRRMKVDYNIS